jgi:hypothetical protein
MCLSILVLTSCSQKVVYRIPYIDTPPPVAVPAIRFVRYPGMICVNVENARKLKERDLLLRDDAASLRRLIEELNSQFAK